MLLENYLPTSFNVLNKMLNFLLQLKEASTVKRDVILIHRKIEKKGAELFLLDNI